MGLLPPATLVDQTARRAGGVEQATTLQACSKGRYSVEIKSQLKPGIGSLRFTGNKQQYLYFFYIPQPYEISKVSKEAITRDTFY